MAKDKKIRNALKRSEVHRKDKKEKAQDKLKRRMETRKAERNGELGKELKAVSVSTREIAFRSRITRPGWRRTSLERRTTLESTILDHTLPQILQPFRQQPTERPRRRGRSTGLRKTRTSQRRATMV